MRIKLILTVAAILGGAVFAITQMKHFGHGDGVDHAGHDGQTHLGVGLTEPGQGAFAALSEVVQVLEADSTTDWRNVDLTGLRMHLVDMDRVILDTDVTQTELPDGILASATGDRQTIAALRRMVPAHAAQLALDERWKVTAVETQTGAQLRVTSDDPAVAARIKGLGFFGLMASQDHHREHHLMMARGANAHAH